MIDRAVPHSAVMEDRTELLRRRIALYRRYLREGVNDGLAVEYLRQIAEDEAELARAQSANRASPI